MQLLYEELIFKFKKFSSILCHLWYYCRKRENEHVCTYIYRHGAWALAAYVAPRDAQKQHSKSHACSSAKSSVLNAYMCSSRNLWEQGILPLLQ